VPQLNLHAHSNGLILDAKVGYSVPRRTQMYKQGKTVPPAVEVTLIVDTGADSTMLNSQVMRSLGLTPTGQTRVLTSGSNGVPELCDVYDIELEILNRAQPQHSWRISALEVLARSLENQGTEGMLGRDVLQRGILHYNGPKGIFSLTF